jgi:glycosyltransferase involved in cell wall biosynthesis
MNIKVLHLYSGNLYGGVETLLTTLAGQRHLCPQLQSEFALCFEGRLAANIRTTGAPLHIFTICPRFSRPWTIWQVRQQLKQLLRKEHYDLVICHSVWTQAIFGKVVKASQIPLVIRIPDLPSGTHWLERLAQRTRPDLVISNSFFTATAIPKLYPNVYCRVVYNPLAAPHVSEEAKIQIRQDLDTDPKQTVIIQICRLERWKGHQVLLSALGSLKEQSDWTCWVVGGPQRPREVAYFKELQTRAQQLGIGERIKFLGQRYDIANLLAAANIFCQPNIEPEPFGNIFVEALYAGLPVVTSAMAGGQEIVTSECGRLVPPNEPEFLANTLAELIRNESDRTQLGAAAKVRAAQICDPGRQLKELYQVLLPILPKSR